MLKASARKDKQFESDEKAFKLLIDRSCFNLSMIVVVILTVFDDSNRETALHHKASWEKIINWIRIIKFQLKKNQNVKKRSWSFIRTKDKIIRTKLA